MLAPTPNWLVALTSTGLITSACAIFIKNKPAAIIGVTRDIIISLGQGSDLGLAGGDTISAPYAKNFRLRKIPAVAGCNGWESRSVVLVELGGVFEN
jgi:hypothetical protein